MGISDNRRVSLLLLPGKILGKIVHRRAEGHLEDHKLLSINEEVGGSRKLWLFFQSKAI